MKILFIDTETTGFSEKTQDLWQLAGYVTEDRQVLDTFNFKCSFLQSRYIVPYL